MVLIQLDDIEEFERVKEIPRQAISDVILSEVRQLDERTQIEPFLREILADKTETPHGPTEIADIVTTHVTLRGKPTLTAFINKGKGTTKVTAKEVSHQVSRVRRMPGVGLIILLAVGNIQDDIKADLAQAAFDAQIDYMIADATDIARLFIAYYKICPFDGVPYDTRSCPKCGNEADGPITLIIPAYEEPEHDVLEHRDVSHGSAKRYTADVWTDRHYTKDTLRKVIGKVISQIRTSNVYQTKLAESRFGNRPADVVWIFVYFDELDRQAKNWYCRAQWISPDLPKNARPHEWQGEKYGEILIDWRKDYDVQHRFWREHQGSKQEWIQKIESLLPHLANLIAQAHSWLNGYEQNTTIASQLESKFAELEQVALNISSGAGNAKLPPSECQDCDQLFQNMVAQCHNTFLPFATWGTPTERSLTQKLWLTRNALREFEKNRQRFDSEWQKFRS